MLGINRALDLEYLVMELRDCPVLQEVLNQMTSLFGSSINEPNVLFD